MTPRLDRGMGWLALGVAYSLAYVLIGSQLQDAPAMLPWFRIAALSVPPVVGVGVIVRRRHTWAGCQWLFWVTLALGLVMSAIGIVGWTVDELLLGRATSWLGWHAVFALFGSVAPLLALLAQAHRGVRERATATTAVDVAGIAVLAGFLYSHFVVESSSGTALSSSSAPLLLLSELQQLLACVGMTGAVFVTHDPAWRQTYRRLALGLLVGFATLTLSNAGIWQGSYQSVSILDVMWILPYFFYPWATVAAPASIAATRDQEELAGTLTPSRPWVIFSGLALIPLIDYGLRRLSPSGLDGVHDVTIGVTIASVLPLLMARLAVERAEVRHVDTKLRLLAAAVEQADEQILIMADGRFQHANEAFFRATGYAPAELATINPSDLMAPESVEKGSGIDAVTGQGLRWQGTIVRRRKDGSSYQASSTVVPLPDERGQLTYFVRVERDITDELQLRDQLIHRERLSAVGQLVSGVAHELNNPLQSVLGFTELLLEAETRPEPRRDLEQVRAQAIRAGKIVHNLLAFVHRTSTERALVDVNDLVRATIALRSYELALENITLDERYAEGLPPVLVNPEEIEQVILNLILNAEQAMRAAHARGVLATSTVLAGNHVIVEIKDDGPGVAADVAGRIFEPFFTTKGVGNGTGLGLSISMGIAQAHGGGLLLVPSERGACFHLRIPIPGGAELMSGGQTPSP